MGQTSDPTSVSGEPSARDRWLAALRTQAEDATAAGLDATAPPGRRLLGRRAARQKILAARRALRELFAAVGLAPDDAQLHEHAPAENEKVHT